MEKPSFFFSPTQKEMRMMRLFDVSQKTATEEVLFKALPKNFNCTGYSVTNTLEDADFMIVPYAIKTLTPKIKTYLQEVFDTARRLKKKSVVFLTGDYCHKVHVNEPDVIVFKGSEYRRARKHNEIIFAPFVEDLGETTLFTVRHKDKQPTVGFCGYAKYPSLLAKIKFTLMNVLFDIFGRSVYKPGLYWRERVLNVLRNDKRFATRFIERTSFSGNKRTIGGDPVTYRREFIENITNADFTLCPKGDANFSARFFETLSLGRIPVLIDTDMILPFEQEIDYSKFIVRVPYQDVDRVGDYITRFWDSHSDEEFSQAQQRARDIFRTYLRFDAYFNRALPRLKQGGIEAVV